MNERPNILNRRRRGFAVIFAITLVILVGATLAVLGTYFVSEARRTRNEAAEAQLRQLLTAGAAAAIQRADAAAGEASIALPPDLGESDASLTIRLGGDGGDRSALVQAKMGARQMEQALRLHRADGRWSIISVTLDSSSPPPASTQPARHVR